MKKVIVVFAVLAALAGFGAANDTVITFSTPGTDRYADGTKVLDGESYALVWTADGAVFGGLSAACETLVETDRLVLVASLAKGGKCPVTVLEIAAAKAAEFANGAFALYLLDTRVVKNGKTVPADYKNGRPQVVNALGAATTDGDPSVATRAGVAGSVSALSSVSLAHVGVYTRIDAPQITALKVDGAKIRLEVKGLSPAAEYFVVPGSVPGDFANALDAELDTTEESASFTFEKPAEEATFYKVIGVRKFGAGK